MPLTKHAVDMFRLNEIDGASFLKEHIPLGIKETYGVYVGAIAAVDKKAKASALMLLHGILEHYRRAKIKVIIARPTTTRGKELAEFYEMQPVATNVIDGHHLYERIT